MCLNFEFEYFEAIGSRNAAKSMQKEVEGQVMQLKALYLEKQMELERFIGFFSLPLYCPQNQKV